MNLYGRKPTAGKASVKTKLMKMNKTVFGKRQK